MIYKPGWDFDVDYLGKLDAETRAWLVKQLRQDYGLASSDAYPSPADASKAYRQRYARRNDAMNLWAGGRPSEEIVSDEAPEGQ